MSYFDDMKEQRAANNNGFGYDRALASTISFKATVAIAQIDTVRRMTRDGREYTFYSLQDQFGAKFSAKDKKLINRIPLKEPIHLEGSIKVVKGATYMNVESAEHLDGSPLMGGFRSEDESELRDTDDGEGWNESGDY